MPLRSIPRRVAAIRSHESSIEGVLQRHVWTWTESVFKCIVIVWLVLLLVTHNRMLNAFAQQETIRGGIKLVSEQVENHNFAPINSTTTTMSRTTTSTDQVVEFLLNLARLPTKDLRHALDQDDVFHLSSLLPENEDSSCPFGSLWPEWLPPMPDPTASTLFRRNKEAVIWYEHLSKAGGTSFCKLANQNMAKQDVPRFYCMPSEGKKRDGRVGLWSNDKLVSYLDKHSYRIVSNEWNPFDANKFELHRETQERVQLVFVTSIRNPLDRLLSAHQFWGASVPLGTWLVRRHALSKRTQIPDWDVARHVARYNFCVWKFSNGTMPLLTDSPARMTGANNKETIPLTLLRHDQESSWRRPFETAIRTLARFNLVLPTELVGEYPQLLAETLGWTEDVGTTHVVPMGKVLNNKAKQILSQDHYDILWDANRFDMILYYWIKAVYLTRIRCAGVL